jgi:hypothetical protein
MHAQLHAKCTHTSECLAMEHFFSLPLHLLLLDLYLGAIRAFDASSIETEIYIEL